MTRAQTIWKAVTTVPFYRERLTAWRTMPLHRRIDYLRWSVPLAVLVLVALHQTLIHALFGNLTNVWHLLSEWAVYGLTGVVVAWVGLSWIARAIAREEQDAAKLRQAYADLAEINQRLLSVHTIGSEAVTAADPLEVLELAARAPVQVAGAVSSAVFTFDNEKERLKLEMAWGLNDTYLHALRQRVQAGISTERCRSCKPLTARVTNDCPLFQGLETQAQADGMASLVCLPIARDERRVGVVGAYYASPAGPPEAEMRLLNIIATEIAAALEGARLRARQMAALSAVGQVAGESADIDTFLNQVLETVLAEWNVEAGALLLYDPLTATWLSRVARGLGDAPSDPRFGLAVQLCERACASGDAVAWQPTEISPAPAFIFALAVPLRAGGSILGALCLASRHRALESRQMPFVTLLAQQIALAVRNAQLNSQQGHTAVLEERYRLSREMHDGLAQTLSYLGWQMDHMEMLLQGGRLEPLATELSEARRTVREAYLDAREAIDGLRLAVDHPGGLPAALREYLDDFSTRTGIVTAFETRGRGTSTPLIELQLLRIAQEALTNVRKHSKAAHVRVDLHRDEKGWELIVVDDGQGFDLTLPRSHHHLGLATMRERATSVGGSLTIATVPGQGTRITASVPMG
jgi:signal transduction histidine kinase